jgi:hypothetical protein
VTVQVQQIMAQGGTLQNCVSLPSLTGGSLQGDLQSGLADNTSCKSQLQPGARGNPFGLLLPAFATLGLVGWRRKLVRARK